MTETNLRETPVSVERISDLRDENKARWIRVSVDMLEHEAFAGEPFSKHAAWLWLIANAAWKPRRFKVANVNGMIELQRGQTLAARGYLAQKWMWGEKKVRLFLEFLQSENMIEMGQSKGRFANVVTICNYEKYQNAPDNKGQLEGQLRAGSGPVEGQTLTSNTNLTNLDSCQTADTSSVAARGPNEENQIQGLNGSTGMIVEHVAHWLSPWAPDYPAAHRSVADLCRIYSPRAVRDGFADLKAAHSDGRVVALSHKALVGFVRASDERQPGKKSAPVVNAKVEAARATVALIDAKIAGFNS